MDNPEKTLLTDGVMRSLQVTRVFKDKACRVNSLDWDAEGKTLVASGSDDTIHTYSMETGDISGSLSSKKHGVYGVKFAHQGARTCFCASNYPVKNGYAVRYWDITENRFVRCYLLPAQVCQGRGLSVHPSEDIIAAAVVDGSVRLFNFSFDTQIGVINSTHHTPIAEFDPSGRVLACYLGEQKLRLFDINNLAAGEFRTIDLSAQINLMNSDDIESMRFAPNGQTILLSTTRGRIVSVDAFDGSKKVEFCFGTEEVATPGYPTISPDCKFVICGGPNNKLHIWDAESGNSVVGLGGHPVLPSYVEFNPRKAVLSSACMNVLLWQPSMLLGQG